MSIWKTKWGWRSELMHKGKRIRAKGFFQYKDQARQWIEDEKDRLKNQKPSFSPDDLSYWRLTQKYLETCRTNISRNTLVEKTTCLERFYAHVGDVDITDISPEITLDFLNERADQLSNNAANRDRKNIKAFYSWVQEIYGIMYDPTGPIRKKPHTKKARRLIPITDILKVIMAAEGHDRVLMETYWHTGARKSEIYRWIWAEDVNFEERWVRLGTRKGKTGEMVYEKLWMNDDLHRSLIWQWKHRHPTSPYVFCHMNPKSKKHGVNKLYGKPFNDRKKKLKNLCKKAGVETFGFHDIRHTVAKYLNDLQKVGLKKVQHVMRHRKQSTTEIYVEGNYSDTREAMMLLEMDKLRKVI